MITDRKNTKGSDDTEERYIGFATNRPTVRTWTYAKRCEMEKVYSNIWERRAKI